jgi:N-methylhydantoinase A
VRTYLASLEDVDFADVVKICEEMNAEAFGVLKEKRNVHTQILVDLRYVGQEFSLSVPVDVAQLRSADAGAIRKSFDELHERRYAHHAADEPVEMINIRLVAVGQRAGFEFPRVTDAGSDAIKSIVRPVYMGSTDHPVDCVVYYRESLPVGYSIEGPALIQEYASTTVMFEGDHAEVAPTGEIVITLRKA